MPSQITPPEKEEFDISRLEAQLNELNEAVERLTKQAAIITGLDLEKGEI